MCEKAKGGQSHTAHRVVAFEPYAPAALFLRIAITVLVIRSDHVRLPPSFPSPTGAWRAPYRASLAFGAAHAPAGSSNMKMTRVAFAAHCGKVLR